MNINSMNKAHQPYSHSKSRVVRFWGVMAFDFVIEPSLLGELVTKSTLNIVFSVTNFTLSRSILIVNRSCRITNTKCSPNTSCRSLSKKNLDSLDLQHYNYCHLLSVFSSTFQSFLTVIHFLNDRMLNIPKLDEHKLNWDEIFANICLRSVIRRLTIVT